MTPHLSQQREAGILRNNPILHHELRRLWRDPVKAIVVFGLILAGLMTLVLFLNNLVYAARLSSRPNIGFINSVIFGFLNNIQFYLPLIPLVIFIRRMDQLVQRGALAELALTPLTPEAILVGWLGAGLVWGSLFMLIVFIPIIELRSPSILSAGWLDTLAIMAYHLIHLLESWGALLAGLPFALYLTLTHRARVNAMLFTALFIAGLWFLIQNTGNLLHWVVCGSARIRTLSIWSEPFIRLVLSLGIHAGLGILFTMKAGAQLSGYFVERLESGASANSAGRHAPFWFRASMFRELWGGMPLVHSWRWLGFFILVAASASAFILPGSQLMELGYIIIVFLLFSPVIDDTLNTLPRLWQNAYERRVETLPTAYAPPGSMAAFAVFKAIYYPFFYLNMVTALAAGSLCFGIGYGLIEAGFYRSYQYAIMLPISAFLLVMLTQLYGSFGMLAQKGGRAGRVQRQMGVMLAAGFAGMAVAGFAINHLFIHSPRSLSIWAWVLTFSLAGVFPLASWYNLKIERRLRGMWFVIPEIEPRPTSHIEKVGSSS